MGLTSLAFLERSLLGCPSIAGVVCLLVALVPGAAGAEPATAEPKRGEPKGALAERLAKVQFDHYATAPGYSEGPTWRGGEVFFCSGALLRVDKEKQVSKYLDLGPAGTVLRGDGHLVVCDNKYKALLDVAPDGKVGVIVDQFETRPLRSLNDLTIDARGNVYWTDPEGSSPQNPVGSLYRVRPDGRVDRIATGLAFPNGIEVDPASRHLYLIESQTKKVLRYELPADDDLLGSPELFYDLGGSGGDGCAFDAAGNLWVADFSRPETKTGRITVLSPQAEVLAYLSLPSQLVSNIAFGGANHDEIFCTTGNPPGVFHAVMGVKGFAGHPGVAMPTVRSLNLVPRQMHADAETLREIAKVAAEAGVEKERFDTAAAEKIAALMASLTDAKLRTNMQQLVPLLEKAAVRYQQDRPLMAEIKRLKGVPTLEITAPDWLRSLAGDEALAVFGRVVELNWNERTDGHKAAEKKPLTQRVHDETLKLLVGQDRLRKLELSGTAVTSAGLVHLKDLTALEILNVCLTEVSDDGFEHLAALTKMRRMTLCASKITGAGFRHLQDMKQIESINLHSSPASDAGLEAISKLTSLRRLEIVHTKVTDAGLAHLASLVNLRQLHVHSPEVTANGLAFVGQLRELYELDVYQHPASSALAAEVAKLPKLRFLRLFNGQLRDQAVEQLSELKTLEELTLQSCSVSDGALRFLDSLKNLRVLNLTGTIVTRETLTGLKQHLPKVQILPP